MIDLFTFYWPVVYCHDALAQELDWCSKILICWLDWQCLCQSWLTDQLSVSSDKHQVGNQAKTWYHQSVSKLWKNLSKPKTPNVQQCSGIISCFSSYCNKVTAACQLYLNTTHEVIIYIYNSWIGYLNHLAPFTIKAVCLGNCIFTKKVEHGYNSLVIVPNKDNQCIFLFHKLTHSTMSLFMHCRFSRKWATSGSILP